MFHHLLHIEFPIDHQMQRAPRGLNYYFSIFLKDHMHKTFPFGNYRMEKKIFLFLGRSIRHNIITHFIENLKPKLQQKGHYMIWELPIFKLVNQ
jgi:hypothetical protein